jgi:hypothetical protein
VCTVHMGQGDGFGRETYITHITYIHIHTYIHTYIHTFANLSLVLVLIADRRPIDPPRK